jgi:hypothetical protein
MEVDALLGQPVLVPLPLPRRLVRDPPQDPVVHQRGEPVGQHRLGRAEHPLEVGEPAHAEECLAQHQQAPLLADDGQRARDRAPRPVPQGFAHALSIVR